MARVAAGFVAWGLMIAWPAAVAVADFTLVENGRPRAAVVLPAEPQELERLAAAELVEHIRLISGAELPLASGEAPQALSAIQIGQATDAQIEQRAREQGDNPSSFGLVVDDDRVQIRGVSPEGTLFGAYELLEQLGVRWYMPGEFGRVIPSQQTLRLPAQKTYQAPSMVYRKLQHLNDDVPWARRARLGGEVRSTGRHGIPGLPLSDFQQHPEWYSWDAARGERRPRQDCLSHPEVLKRATEGIRREAAQQGGRVQYVGAASHDGGGYCECENCRALDQGVYDPTGDRESMTDRYIWFFNRVLENLENEFPNLHIVHYTYGAHMMPPAIEMNPRIVPVFAPITLDRTRGMDNPMSPDRHLLRWLIDEYAQRGVQEMYYRGYYHNLACPQLAYSQLDRIRHETPVFAAKGITVMRVENIHTSWATAFLDLYLATRMMWDVSTDVDALLEEFYDKFYGPAADPMRQYHQQLEAAFRDTPYMTGSTFLYIPIFLGQPRREELRSHLDRAAAELRGQPEVFAQRLQAVRLGWDRTEAWLDMIEARNKHDFTTAHQKMQEFDRLSDKGAEQILEPGSGRGYTLPRLVFERERSDYSGSYFNRFWRAAVVEGHRRAVEIGEIVAPLPDEWMSLLDPSDSGELMGYPRPGELGGNWQPLKTTSRSWSDQGLHYYKGVAWYRTRVNIPAEFEGRPVYLWFGGVDRLASVWINGQFMGTSREPREGLPGVPGSFRPFDMPTSGALKFGQENWVVVRIENKTLSELGTGGILAPVMFWSPKDPVAAESIRGAAETP